ncbi:hypothetical protein WJX73_005977 [Symbiochloris irregularis]|uniref:Transcription elongation factor SPT4 homolog n=1 Tax=Symbiochloris irregularis TaxID=706552 RepID=A0AAW1NPP3_9CHLO
MAHGLERHAEPPMTLGKSLVACMVCRLVKLSEQFYQDGCENCTFLDMAQNRGRCEDCTTINFQGIITVINPASSWAAKWLHMGHSTPGCYALSVRGDLTQEIEDVLRENNRSRNTSNC